MLQSQRKPHFFQSLEDAINEIFRAVRANSRRPTFNQEQMNLLLPDILSHLHGLTVQTEQLENALSRILTSLHNAHSQLTDQSRLLSELSSRPANPPLDRTAAREVARDVLMPVMRSEVATFQIVVATVMARMRSARAAERQATPERQLAMVRRSTGGLTPTADRIMISATTQTEVNDAGVASTSIDVDSPHVLCDNSEVQRSTDVMEPGADELANELLPQPMEDVRLSPGLNVPTPDLIASEGDVSDDRTLVSRDSVDTEGQGITM